MAESDDRLGRSYRGLAREEPPPALDAAILAAARESVRPRARNRWAGPVSIAAVLVLGLGVSLRMQTEQPGIEASSPSSASSAEYPSFQSADTAAPDASVKATRPQARAKDALAPAPRAKPQEAPPLQSEKNVAAAPASASESLEKKRNDAPATEVARAEARPFAEAPAAAAASPAPMRAKREVAAGALADSAARPDADERLTELERIARLRRDGKDAQADKALEEFRRRNPGYRIPEAMWERVRPR